MTKSYCYKSNPESDFGKAVKKYYMLLPLWSAVADAVSELLGEKITKMAQETDELWIDTSEVSAETKKLFTKDGKLKANSKRANEIRKEYKRIISSVGLTDFQDLRFIKFAYGIMRTSRQQRLESFICSECDMYLKADYDMLYRDKSAGSISPISEIEFEEKYLSELKKQEEESA